MTRLPVAVEIANCVAAIEAAKSAGAYADANLMFAATLSVVSRGGRDLPALAAFCEYEVGGRYWLCPDVTPDEENYQVACYYDLVNIVVPGTGMRTCIPVPMLAPEVWAAIFSRVPTFERGDHCRAIDVAREDVWTPAAAGYKAMGEEAIAWAFSDHGRAELEYLRSAGRVGVLPTPDEFGD